MLFENSPWAGTVIKLLMTTLFFISELIFREITWWWTKPEWWPGRRNSLVSEIKVASSGDLESFIGTHCFFSVAWPNPPEHSLEAGGGWWRLVEASGGAPDYAWRLPPLLGPCRCGVEELLGGAITLLRTQSQNQGKPALGLLAGAFLWTTVPDLHSQQLRGASLLSSTAFGRIWPSVCFLSRKYTSLSGTQTKFTAMMSKETHQ